MENENNGLILYKYISFAKFIDLVELERSYLTNIKLWEDTYEGAGYVENFGYGVSKYVLESIRSVDNLETGLTNISKKLSYAQSWTDRELESDAMWRIYSTDKLGVRIAVSKRDIEMQINKTLNTIEDSLKVEPYKVDYDKESNPEDGRMPDGGLLVDDTLKFKRKAFAHEEEYRFSTCIPIDVKNLASFDIVKHPQSNNLNNLKILGDFLNKATFKPVIYYDLPSSMIKEIILDPRASKNDTEMFMKYCKNRGFTDKNIDYRKSDLYNEPSCKY